MIRPLEVSELDLITQIANEWYATSTILRNFNLDVFKKTWIQLLNTGVGVIFGLFEGDNFNGMIGGFAHPDINSGEQIATECFWYVKKNVRGKGLYLLNAFEKWAKEKKCRTIRMSQLLENDEQIEKIYERRKYYPIEVVFSKEIQSWQ
jgi:GNAT superfamily N-acetyltransferase